MVGKVLEVGTEIGTGRGVGAEIATAMEIATEAEISEGNGRRNLQRGVGRLLQEPRERSSKCCKRYGTWLILGCSHTSYCRHLEVLGVMYWIIAGPF